MQIKKLDTYKSFRNDSVLDKPEKKTNKVSMPVSLSLPKIPVESIKAAYMPSFGCYKKVGEATLKDKTTGKAVSAEIQKKHDVDEYITYRLYADNKQIGLMDMALNEPYLDYDKSIPKDKNPVPYERFPKIIHLRSLSGDKYSGIGSTLVNLAVEESKNCGKKGALWLNARKGYLKYASKYRSDENPIPFYYKLGFRAPRKADDEEIKLFLETQEYDKLPPSELLILTPEAAAAKNKYLVKNFTLNENAYK